MATLVPTLNPISFPHEVDQLVVSASGDFRFEMLLDNKVLLSSRLTPDRAKKSYITDLAQLIIDSLPEDSDRWTVTTYHLVIKLDGTVVAQTYILPCRLRLDESAMDFINQSFLTPCGARKRTHRKALEYLFAYYGPDDTLGYYGEITSYWVNSDNNVIVFNQKVDKKTMLMYDDGDSFSLDVSPSKLQVPPSESPLFLSRYDVVVGARRQNYILFPQVANLTHVKDFSFINAFGIEDTFHCFSIEEKETKFEYHAAIVHAYMRNYLIQAIPSWKIKTGPLLDEERILIEDFCTSNTIESAEGLPLTITVCEMKESDAWAYQTEAVISYRHSQNSFRNHIGRPVQTFDQTFDKTFE